MNLTPDEAQRRYQQAYKDYISLKPLAGVTRQQFLADKSEDPTSSEEERNRAHNILIEVDKPNTNKYNSILEQTM